MWRQIVGRLLLTSVVLIEKIHLSFSGMASKGVIKMKQKYEKIFQQFTFPSGVEVKNRIMVAPMTHYSSEENGEVSDT